MDHPLAKYRKLNELSQDEAAAQLGLSSKSSISNIESGLRPAPLRLGLQIHVWSQGKVQAADVVSPEDSELITAFVGVVAEARAA